MIGICPWCGAEVPASEEAPPHDRGGAPCPGSGQPPQAEPGPNLLRLASMLPLAAPADRRWVRVRWADTAACPCGQAVPMREVAVGSGLMIGQCRKCQTVLHNLRPG